MKPYTFKPERESKKYEEKIGMFQKIEQYERVYKF